MDATSSTDVPRPPAFTATFSTHASKARGGDKQTEILQHWQNKTGQTDKRFT